MVLRPEMEIIKKREDMLVQHLKQIFVCLVRGYKIVFELIHYVKIVSVIKVS
jgi:hypothetical protein